MLKSEWLKCVRTLAAGVGERRRRNRSDCSPSKALIEVLEDRALLAAQVINATPNVQAVLPNGAVSIDVDYTTKDDNGNATDIRATTLGLRLHYDSSALSFNGLTDLFTTGFLQQADQAESAAESDGDASTDRFVNVAWFDISGNWPGASTTPAFLLYTANFTAAANFSGSTVVNFTRSAEPTNLTEFESNSPVINEFIIPDVSISDAADVTEGGSSVFTVSLSENPSGVVTVNYSTAHNTTDDNDYTTATNQTLTFNPGGPLTQPVSVLTTQDGNVEPNESFFVNLTSATNANLVDLQGQATIVNDDVPTVSVSDAGTIAEGSAANFIVSLDQAPLADVTVTVSTANGTASEPGDYTSVSGQTLTFSPGNPLTQQVTVSTINDALAEADEDFFLDIVTVVGGVESAANGRGTATLSANDPPVVTISDVAGVNESGVATFVVSLDQTPAVALTVDYATAEGTATTADDFIAKTGTLTFAPGGSLTQEITVQTVQDALVEPSETFLVNLTNPVNGILADTQGQATILDDDFPAISISDAGTIAEGNDAVFIVSLDQNPVSVVTVTLSTADGSASAPGDYTSVAGLTLTFNPGGALSQQVTVSTIDDVALEPNENFHLNATSATGATIANGQGEATLTSADVAVVSISNVGDVAEGQNAEFAVSVNEAPLPGQDLTVTVTTASGTATADVDYTSTSQTLTFTSSGSLTQTFSVATLDDSLVEANETFVATLSNVGNGTIGVAQGQANIVSEDVPAVSVSDAAAVAEGQNSVFTVSLDQAPLTTVTIQYLTADGSATAPDDYTAAGAQTLTFTPGGVLTQAVSISTIDDSLVEGDENFVLNLRNPVGVTIADGQGVATITSDDVPTVSIAHSPNTAEGQAASFAVSIDQLPLPGQDLTVQLLSAGDTAVDGTDYTSLDLTLTFTSATSTSQVVLVGTTDDNLVEPNEEFVVSLNNVVNGNIGTAQGRAVIVDNDVPAVSIDDVSVNEGDDATFTVSLDQAPVANVTVTLNTADGTAVSPEDFTTRANVVLTFVPGGPLTQQVAVTTIDDALVELTENFTLDIASVLGGTVADGQGQATVISDDGPSLSVSGPGDVAEGAEAAFIVALDQAPLPGLDVTVTVATVSGTAAAGADFTAVNQTLTFTSGSPLTQQVNVSTTDDSLVESTEGFSVQLTNPGNAGLVVSSATANILDDDIPTVSISDSPDVAEGQNAVFTLTLDQAPVSAATFSLSTTDGTATSPDDFSAVNNQSVTFVPGGPLTQQVTVSTVDDTVQEFDEGFTIAISNENNVSVAVRDAQATIISDDAPEVSVGDAGNIAEGDIATFVVSISELPLAGRDLTVDVRTLNGSAEAGSDFDAVNQTLTFTSAGPLTQQVEVQTTDDTIVEILESFDVQLLNVANGIISDSIGAATIESDDLPGVSISDAAAVTEGQDTTFTVTLDQAPGSVVTVTVSTADDTAFADVDYQRITSQTLTFTTNSPLTQSITINTIDDPRVETVESFFVNLTEASGLTITDGQAIGTINDNERTVQTILDPAPRYAASVRPTLTWQQTGDAVDYEIWLTRRFPASTRLFPTTSDVSGTSFTPSQDLGAGFYKYWVRAIYPDGGLGAWSEEESFEVRPTLIRPLLPTFSLRPTFEWNLIPNAPGYQIFIRTIDGDIVETDLQGTSYTPSEDLPRGPIEWWIRSSDAIGNRGWSLAGHTGIRAEVLSPNGTVSQSQPTITWTPVELASRYVLHVQNIDNDTVAIREDNLTETSFTPSSGLPDANYRIWVKAIDSATNSFTSGQWSRAVDFQVSDGGGQGSLPSLDVQVVGPTGTTADNTPEITWTSAEGAERYRLFLQDVAGNVIMDDDQLTGTTFTITSPLTNGSYRIWVQAIAATGRTGLWSTPVEFTVEAITGQFDLLLIESDEMLTSLRPARHTDAADSKVPSTDGNDMTVPEERGDSEQQTEEAILTAEVEADLLDAAMSDPRQFALLID